MTTPAPDRQPSTPGQALPPHIARYLWPPSTPAQAMREAADALSDTGNSFNDNLIEVLRRWADELDAAPAADTSTQHVIWYGGPDPDNAAGRLDYDGEYECREMLQWLDMGEHGGGYARRRWVAGPWEIDGAPAAPLSTVPPGATEPGDG